MAMRFCVLASGSSGNASFLEVDGFGVLLDAGIGPRRLASRLATVDRGWPHVHAVLLTHTHADHWSQTTLAHLGRLGIPLYCHADHHSSLRLASEAFADLRAAKLVRGYDIGQPLALSRTLTCIPLALSHDDTTCGFRFEAAAIGQEHPIALAYAADLGSWSSTLADALANADILALEFNHDEFLERSSGRSPALILRVLGDRGHLSNIQAAELLGEILLRSRPGLPRHLVQLHLSRQCNRAALAINAAGVALAKLNAKVAIHTAMQDRPGPFLTVGELVLDQQDQSFKAAKGAGQPRHSQPMLPGWEDV